MTAQPLFLFNDKQLTASFGPIAQQVRQFSEHQIRQHVALSAQAKQPHPQRVILPLRTEPNGHHFVIYAYATEGPQGELVYQVLTLALGVGLTHPPSPMVH